MDEIVLRVKQAVDADPDYVKEYIKPVSLEEIETAEEQLGFRLPTLLRDLYLYVDNGGFGPGSGVLGLSNGWTDDLGNTALSSYLDSRSYRQEQEEDGDPIEDQWREGLLPICYWGCTVYSMLDCTSEDGPVWTWDAGKIDSKPEANSLREWLEYWLGDHPTLTELLEVLLKDEDKDSRAKAADDLGKRGDREAIPGLFQALFEDRSKYVRQQTVLALTNLGGPEIEKGLLIAFEKETNSDVQYMILNALYNIGTEPSIAVLERLRQEAKGQTSWGEPLRGAIGFTLGGLRQRVYGEETVRACFIRAK